MHPRSGSQKPGLFRRGRGPLTALALLAATLALGAATDPAARKWLPVGARPGAAKPASTLPVPAINPLALPR